MRRILIYLLLIAFVTIACDPVNEEPPVYTVKDKTVLIYMVGNNNLSSNAVQNLSDLKKGYIPQEDGNLLVYYHTANTSPYLFNIYEDKDGVVVQDTVYRFPVQNSAEAASLTSAMKIVQTMYPAREYGLFLWSHGTGWLPEGYYAENPKSFGSENGVEMDIAELEAALPYKLSYVIFDACLMGGVEVAYQLKDSVDYVLASPAEILSDGFPYSKIMQHLFRSPADLQSVAKEYFDYYNAQSGSSRSATISLVKTSALNKVAEASTVIFEKYRDAVSTFDASGVQRYYRSDKYWFYDFGDYITQLAGEDAAPLLKALDNAVVYKAATPKFLLSSGGFTIDPQRYSGLSIYIPNNTPDPVLTEFYKKLKWNNDTEYIK